MKRPELIQQLEAELKCISIEWDISEFHKYIFNDRYRDHLMYSADNKGNVTALSMQFKLESIPHAIKENRLCGYLKILYLAGNQLSDISPLKDLTSLTFLNLASNQLSDISPLKDLTGLTELDLSFNKLSDISPLKDLTSLNFLFLSSNQLSNISPLKDLTSLIELHLSRNQLSDTDISSLKDLTSLNFLGLYGNQLSGTDILPLNELTSLTKLDLSRNQLSDISPLKDLTSLTELHLWSNQLSDISPLKDLTGLTELYLSRNQLSDISPLKDLTNLHRLDLQHNRIVHLPEWICDYPFMDFKETGFEAGFIYLGNNPLKNIPIQIIAQGKAAVKIWFEELKKEKPRYNFEVKLLIIGEGGTGKTTLARKLKDKDAQLPEEKDTTYGIDIQTWQFPLNKNRFKHLTQLEQDSMLVKIWDFGGQKMYHGTHQIFFNENNYYILVEETRAPKTDFSYWFNTIEQLAGEDACIQIVINQKFGYSYPFDTDGYRSRFKFVQHISELDLSKDHEKIITLQEDVKYFLQKMPQIGIKLPGSYSRIKEELFKINKNFISLDRFCEICETNGLTGTENVEILSRYLTGIGTIIHYIDDDVLKNRVFLNSEWLVKMIYKVLDNSTIKEKKGRINKADAEQIWQKEKLDFEIGNLTRLMNNFELMYLIKDKDEFVIPAHLSTKKPYSVWLHHNKSNMLIFKYEFGKYMPEGLMSRLIVSLHNYIENEQYVWSRGLNICLRDTFAEVIETYGEINTFEIKITGTQKRELLAIIRNKFEEITKPFKKLKYLERIPCNCSKCANSNEPSLYEYEDLLRRLENKKSTIECSKNNYKDVDIKNLIEGVILDRQQEEELLVNEKQRISYIDFQLVKPDSSDSKLKILFLSASPIGQAQLQTSDDYKAIKKHLDQTRFELLLPELEVTIDDLIAAMSQQPEIVHFAGHGETEGINIVDKNNITKLLSEEALKSLFKPHKKIIRLVVLNSCYSAEQAKIISASGFHVIGMNSQFGDKAARSFATGLYIGFFKDIKNKNPFEYAFNCGMTKLTAEFPDEVNIPEIWKDGKKLVV